MIIIKPCLLGVYRFLCILGYYASHVFDLWCDLAYASIGNVDLAFHDCKRSCYAIDKTVLWSSLITAIEEYDREWGKYFEDENFGVSK